MLRHTVALLHGLFVTLLFCPAMTQRRNLNCETHPDIPRTGSHRHYSTQQASSAHHNCVAAVSSMPPDVRVGAILLSDDCSCVALVRRSASNLWGFPRGLVNGTGDQEVVKTVVKAETGIELPQTLYKIWFEVG